MKIIKLSNRNNVYIPEDRNVLYFGSSDNSTHAYICNIRHCDEKAIENVLFVTDDENSNITKEKAWIALLNTDPRYYDYLIKEVDLIGVKCSEFPNGKCIDVFGRDKTIEEWVAGTSLYLVEVIEPNHDYWQHVHIVDEKLRINSNRL